MSESGELEAGELPGVDGLAELLLVVVAWVTLVGDGDEEQDSAVQCAKL